MRSLTIQRAWSRTAASLHQLSQLRRFGHAAWSPHMSSWEEVGADPENSGGILYSYIPSGLGKPWDLQELESCGEKDAWAFLLDLLPLQLDRTRMDD